MTTLKTISCMKLLGSAALASLLMASPAHAQIQEEQEPPQEDRSATDEDVPEIVVTAQKREEAILDIPQSVSVVGGDTLEKQQATTFQDYAALIPGLSFEESNPGNTRIILRGVNTGGVSSTVAVYVDEVPFGSSSGLVNGAILAADIDTFDIARLEVLRGPQGTLYGASSLGGVVKFVTNLPELGETSGRVRAGIETVDDGEIGWNTTGVVNIPLGQTAAVRATGYYRRKAGWIDATEGAAAIGSAGSLGGEDINEADVYGGRASLLFQPVEPLSIRLSALTQTIDSEAQNLVEVDPDSQDPVGDGLVQTVFIPEHTKTRYRVLNGTIEYDLGFASLLSSTSHARLKQTFLVDLAPTFGPLITFLLGDFATQPLALQQDQETSFRKFTQEVRLTSPSDDRFEWLLGAYYTKEKGLIRQDIFAFDLLAGQIAGALPIIGEARLPTEFEEIAGFANATVHLTDRFDVTAGGRWSKNNQDMEQELGGLLFPPTNTSGSSEEDVFTYSLAPRFEVSDTTAVYARVAKGYRPGGPNVLPPNPPPGTPATFDADTITSYEAGLKTDIGRRVALDLSAYVLKWDDIQLFTIINNVGLNANGGKATSKGIEGSLTLRPMTGLQLLANAALIDAELDEDAPDAGGFKGDDLPWTPEFSFGLSGDYEWPVSGAVNASVGASLRYVGERSADFDAAFFAAEGHQRKIDDYATVDLRAGVDFGRFAIDAFVKNLTNSRGITSFALPEVIGFGGPALPGGAANAAIIQPRTIGLSIGAQF